MLSCVIYSVMENYFWIDHIFFNSKTLSVISSDKISEEASYNELLAIGIPEGLMNLVSCHGLTKKPNLTVILVCQSCLMNYYLSKVFVII